MQLNRWMAGTARLAHRSIERAVAAAERPWGASRVAAVREGTARCCRFDLSCRLQLAALTAKGSGAVKRRSGLLGVSKFAATLRRIDIVNEEG